MFEGLMGSPRLGLIRRGRGWWLGVIGFLVVGPGAAGRSLWVDVITAASSTGLRIVS